MENTHIPKYAAGDDMDKIKRSNNKSPISIKKIGIILVIVIITYIFFWPTHGGLNSKIVSVENQYTEKIAVVTIYSKNESNKILFNISAVLHLKEHNADIKNAKKTSVAKMLLPGQSKTITTKISTESLNENAKLYVQMYADLTPFSK